MARNPTYARSKTPNGQAIRNADKFIALLKAFQSGAQIQRKSRWSDWHDIDLADYIKASAVLYRVKKPHLSLKERKADTASI